MMAELLPCKCGNEDIRLTNWGLWRAWCSVCLRQSADELTKKEAMKSWNTRTQTERGDTK